MVAAVFKTVEASKGAWWVQFPPSPPISPYETRGLTRRSNREQQFPRHSLPPPAELAAEIVESLEVALEEFRGVEEALNPTGES